jgi:hypothetical protein
MLQTNRNETIQQKLNELLNLTDYNNSFKQRQKSGRILSSGGTNRYYGSGGSAGKISNFQVIYNMLKNQGGLIFNGNAGGLVALGSPKKGGSDGFVQYIKNTPFNGQSEVQISRQQQSAINTATRRSQGGSRNRSIIYHALTDNKTFNG